MRQPRRFARAARAFVVLLLLPGAVGACGSSDAPTRRVTAGELTGTFRIEPGRCDTVGLPEGSWVRFVRPGGSPANGPFVMNEDSTCIDHAITLLAPGENGGIRTGRYQPDPVPAFDPAGNAEADDIIQPTVLAGVRFSLSTNRLDPQHKLEVGPPRIAAIGRALHGDLRGVSMPWQAVNLNQGAPKPDGAKPVGTTNLTGAYDPASRTFQLEWSSAIVGGALNNHYGVWHLEGQFEPD